MGDNVSVFDDADHVVINGIPIEVEAWAIIRSFAGSPDSGRRFLASLLTGLFVVLQHTDPASNEYSKIKLYINFGMGAAHRAVQQDRVDSAALSSLCELTGKIMKQCPGPKNLQELVCSIMIGQSCSRC